MKKLVLIVSIVCWVTLDSTISKAQSISAVEDGTKSTVDRQGNVFNINGGTLSSDSQNLFHSLQKFGLNKDEIGNFLTNPNVRNILTRIVGGEASIIDGLIQVTGGNSNLFILNPAGIFFGINASLNLPADFIATTATGIGFDNNLWFNTFGTNDYQNLVGIPSQLKFNETATGTIINLANLDVARENNLALVAGNTINLGTIASQGGNITISAVAGSNRVRLSQERQILSLEIELPSNERGELLPIRVLDLPALLTGLPPEVKTQLNVTSNRNLRLINADLIIPPLPGTAIISGNLNVDNGHIQVLGEHIFVGAANINGSAFVRARENLLFKQAIVTTNGGDFTGIGLGNGISLNNTSIIAASGNLELTGVGGNIGFEKNYGISLDNQSKLEATTGKISLFGTGGLREDLGNTPGRQKNYGVYISNSTITNRDGEINLLGRGGGNKTGSNNVGIFIERSKIESNGFGNVALEGTGGASTTGGHGIRVTGNSLFSTADGNLQLIGSGNTQTSGVGIFFSDETVLKTTGLGKISFREGEDPDNKNSAVLLDKSAIDTKTEVIFEGTDLVFNNTDIQGIVSFDSLGRKGDVNWNSSKDVNLGNTKIQNNLNITTAGKIEQTSNSQIIVGETTTLDTRGDINLSKNNNDFNSVVIKNANNVNIKDNNALNLAKLKITGNLRVEASGDLNTKEIDTSSLSDRGGDISLISTSGQISAGNLNTSGIAGGNINLQAASGIIGERLETFAISEDGGKVFLESNGDIEISYINAQSLGKGIGGEIDIDTESLFRATGSFLDRNNINASIANPGGINGQKINIAYGGGSITNFIIGDPSINGTLAAITNGENTLESGSLSFNSNFGNISVSSGVANPTISPPPQGRFVVNVPVDLYYNEVRDEKDKIFISTYLSEEFSSSAASVFKKLEEAFSLEFEDYLKLERSRILNLQEAENILAKIQQTTGIKSGLIYVFFKEGFANSILKVEESNSEKDELEIFMITASGETVRHSLKGVTRERVIAVTQELQRYVLNPRRPVAFLPAAYQLYQWIVAPLAQELEARKINNLVFLLDGGLRSFPLAVLHDGERFLLEKYSISLMPSISLTDTNYESLKGGMVLAMGASEFREQNLLPTVPIELSLISQQLWQGQTFLNENFTLENFKKAHASGKFNIVHLATHANFEGAPLSNSYLQFWQEKLTLNDLKQLNLNQPPIDLLVLSACRTALGDLEAELGFAGTAVLAKVNTAIGSLWEVSDEGTFSLMTSFYSNLKNATIKAEALREAQLNLLRGKVYLEGGKLLTPQGNFPLPSELLKLGNKKLNHPYYWSGFTVIGSPW
jgi:filamentous hemagglutinin family protein